ncbi:L,D-transpeptidase [Roseivivax sp. CAU 1753]
MLTRRSFTALGAMAGLVACATPQPEIETETETVTRQIPEPILPPMPDFYGAITDEPYPVPALEAGSVPPEMWRREVANPWTGHARGTIVIDPNAAVLHFVESPDRAMRYGVSVGAVGFSWEGTARLQFCRKWPRWKVPATMIERQPKLAPYSVANGGMDPGPGNPMGARALYLFQNGEDTLYRVHGDAKPWELGKAVSSGCIRMLNHDVIDLHQRAVHGATVIVMPSMTPGTFAQIY